MRADVLVLYPEGLLSGNPTGSDFVLVITELAEREVVPPVVIDFTAVTDIGIPAVVTLCYAYYEWKAQDAPLVFCGEMKGRALEVYSGAKLGNMFTLFPTEAEALAHCQANQS
ncbi:MAG: STAS domain-containing protein [Candidatus Komeilibacteria bacterium]